MQMIFNRLAVRTAALAVLIAGAAHIPEVAANDLPEVSYDGLLLNKNNKELIVYRDPDARLDAYSKFILIEPTIAFRKHWERDTRVGGRRVPASEIERIKREGAELFMEVFSEELEKDDHYDRVTAPAADAVILRAAVLDLDIAAPDVSSTSRTRSYTTESMRGVLVLEVVDSETGDILVRAIDAKQIRNAGRASLTTSASNRADARRAYREWARILRDAWDTVRTAPR